MSDRPTVHVYMLDCLWNTTVLISVTNCVFMPIQCAIQRKFTCDVHVKFEWGFDLKIVWIFRACSGWLSSFDRSLDSRSAVVIPTPAELTTAAEHRVRILFLLQVLGGGPIVDAITAFFQCDHLECSLNSFLFPMAFPAATHTRLQPPGGPMDSLGSLLHAGAKPVDHCGGPHAFQVSVDAGIREVAKLHWSPSVCGQHRCSWRGFPSPVLHPPDRCDLSPWHCGEGA